MSNMVWSVFSNNGCYGGDIIVTGCILFKLGKWSFLGSYAI